MEKITKKLQNQILKFQENEISEYYIYLKLSKTIKSKENSKILKKIALEEKGHYEFWKKYTNEDVAPSKWKVFKFYWLSKIFGITFGLKLMEYGENGAQITYQEVVKTLPEVKKVVDDEEAHEKKLISILKEKKLKHIGSIVLGLNDALVELTGTLAGLTFAFKNTHQIALTGLIMGVAASLSMASSEYISARSEDNPEAVTASMYTGTAYTATVILLVVPYFLFASYYIAFLVMLAIAILIIFIFNFYISVAKEYSFKHRFWEMITISMGVSFISFIVGILVNKYI